MNSSIELILLFFSNPSVKGIIISFGVTILYCTLFFSNSIRIGGLANPSLPIRKTLLKKNSLKTLWGNSLILEYCDILSASKLLFQSTVIKPQIKILIFRYHSYECAVFNSTFFSPLH